MAVTLNSTGITFSDGNTQNSAVSGGVPSTSQTSVTSVNSTTNVSVPSNTFFAAVALGGGGAGGSRNPSLAAGNGGAAFGLVGGSSMGTSVALAIGAAGNGGFNAGNPGGDTTWGSNLLRGNGGNASSTNSSGSPGNGAGNFFFANGQQPVGLGGRGGNPSQNIGNPGTAGSAKYILFGI